MTYKMHHSVTPPQRFIAITIDTNLHKDGGRIARTEAATPSKHGRQDTVTG